MNKNRKVFYVYKITLLLGEYKGKFYIGKNINSSLINSYGGSGATVKQYYEDYGKIEGETFTKEILQVVDNELTLIRAEYDFIQKYYDDPNCLNISTGTFIPTTDEIKEKLNNELKNYPVSLICDIFVTQNNEYMGKCIILSRVSSHHQELDSQTKAITEEAKKQGYKLEDFIIIEDVESAIKLSEEERNGLNRMKEEIDKNDVTCVFIYELSRLSRRQLVLFSIRDYLINKNIQLVCCTPYFRLLEDGKLSQTANLMFSIFASMAESEMSLKQERMKRGRMRNKELGKTMGGRALTGYAVDDNKDIVIDEEMKPFVIDMFTLYASGQMSTMEVAEELCARYGQVKDNPYRMRSKISKLLVNRKYAGEENYPQIISRELFDKARAVAASNKRNNKRHIADTALLKKIIYDKKTGQHLTYTSNSGQPRYTLRCENHRSIVTVMTKVIDDAILNLAIVLHKAYIVDNQKVRKEIEEKISIATAKTLNLKVKMKKIDEKVQMVEERLIYGQLSESKAEELEKKLAREKREAAEAELRLAEQVSSLQSLLEHGPQAPEYALFTLEEKISIIRQMVERVEVWKESRYHPVADVYTKVDHFIYEIHFDSWNMTSWMKTRVI